jgi:predicted metal-binding transcription factor (methanogenesis marker protein 9)
MMPTPGTLAPMKRIGKLVLCAAFLLSCGGTPKPPTEELSKAKAVVRAADEVGAKDAPRAALHLKMANDQITSAEELIEKKKMSQARYLLMRAEADAELSIALAKAASKEQEAEEAMAKVQKLKKEIK